MRIPFLGERWFLYVCFTREHMSFTPGSWRRVLVVSQDWHILGRDDTLRQDMQSRWVSRRGVHRERMAVTT